MPAGNLDGAVQIGEWIVTPSLDSISRGTETHKLEPRTTRLLMCLANSAGEVVSVDKLLTEVWAGVVVGSASVYQAVSQLRKLLGDTDPEPTYIATVPRRGYRLVAPVRRLDPPSVPLSAVTAPVGVATVPVAPIAAEPTLRIRKLIPIALLATLLIGIAVAGVLIWKSTIFTRAPSANSIVVLPFIDMTAEKADQSFCDGLTEELSSWLAQIPTLRVVARTSAFAFRGSEDVRKIGKALDTSHILEGSMRRSGDHMRVTVQLIDARNGYHLWSENFDRPIEDAIKVQEDISRSVAETLQVRLTEDAERQLAARRTSDSQAYQLYLLARYYSQQVPEGSDRAIDLYRQVLTADPKFAPAYTQLAYALLNQGQFHDLPVADVVSQAEPLIAAALRLDNRMSSAYAVRGALRASQSRTKEALEDLQLAISLNPSDMGAFAEIGRIRLFEGRPREALKSYDRAAALDPLSFTLQGARCTVLDDLAQYGAAADACERARILQPRNAAGFDGMTWLAESQGHIGEALRWNSEALKADPSGDFNLYWTRSILLLSVGPAAPARAAVEAGRMLTKNEDDANIALLRVAYREGGAQALRSFLNSVPTDQSPHYYALFESAYARLLLGEAAAVKVLIARALAAPDRPNGTADDAWSARGAGPIANSYRIDLAAAEIALGDRVSAQRELDQVLVMLDGMIAAGVERNATYELRARVKALAGKSDDAMRDLSKAVKLGWRSAWWAMHEPYFSSLRQRSDFQALMTQVNQSNDGLVESLKPD
ncbi:MAG TPA: winged helix-turn-helix domain-containing protein [Steroidobacteraceae bacterium]|jgi:TolB-like protein/DNA-binding winged helix-turn-helix (wHTH) protein